MFNNIGNKIKTYAEVVSWIGIIACIILGVISIIVGIANESLEAIFIGILVALIGSLSCWIESFVLYGFGQLVENSDILVKTLAPNYREDITDAEKLNDEEEVFTSSKTEIEKIREEYSGYKWIDTIKNLSDEELQERINSKDWQDVYRILCKNELENRK